MKKLKKKELWIIVQVESGIPTYVKVRYDKGLAEKEYLSLRKTINQEKDEIGIFKYNIDR